MICRPGPHWPEPFGKFSTGSNFPHGGHHFFPAIILFLDVPNSSTMPARGLPFAFAFALPFALALRSPLFSEGGRGLCVVLFAALTRLRTAVIHVGQGVLAILYVRAIFLHCN